MESSQDKLQEICFFDRHAKSGEYNVFSDRSNHRLIDHCLELAGSPPSGRLADLGCGSGVFTDILRRRGFGAVGFDISHQLTSFGRRCYPEVEFVTGDIEYLCLPSDSLDVVLLSGVIHHLPDPLRCAREVHRVLKKGGVFMAFDPNRRNPFMRLYRDRGSPFYGSKGVTKNERPVLAEEIRRVFGEAGFEVRSSHLSGLHYRYLASPLLRIFLPAYNMLDSVLFAPSFLSGYRAFVISAGVKR